MSILEPAPDFETDDGFLHAVLGLLSAGRELRAVVDTAVTEAPVEGPPTEDAVLYALLGLLRLRTKMITVVESWAVEEPCSLPPIFSEGAIDPKEILR